jgi:predicted AAA+ superfamily ATPase
MAKRKLFKVLLDEKDTNKITIILGPRQVGKTTLLKELYSTICTESNQKGIFLDLDILTNYEKISTYENAVQFLKLSGYEESSKSFFYLFLDEFQRYNKLSIVMKNIYDNLKNIKIYATGSSSILIKDQVQESLAGRKNLHTIYPLDFEEFLEFKSASEELKNYNNITKLNGKNLASITAKLNSLLSEFLVFGGYPEVALKKESSEKIKVLESIFDLYVKKDLANYLKHDKLLVIKQLIEYLAINNGQKIKYEEVSSIIGTKFQETKNYLEILKETYLIYELRPFFANKNKELVKIPKIYFIDNGVRNFFINNFNDVSLRNDSGFLFEGYVISEFIKYEKAALKFWQDKNKREVDLIIDRISEQVPIEIKYKSSLNNDDTVGMRACMTSYPKIKKGFIINLGEQGKKEKLSFILPYGMQKQVAFQ